MKSLLMTEYWLLLALAIMFGVLGTMFMKISHGLQKLKPTLCVIMFYTLSFIALTFAMKHIDLSVVYAIWSGVGTVLMAMIGIIYFQESVSVKKIFFLALIIIGVIGVHLSHVLT